MFLPYHGPVPSRSEAPRPFAARLARLVLGLACIVLAAGCTDRASAGPVRELAVPAWTSELPGRAAPLGVTLPIHLDALLPRSPVAYTLRARVEVPEDMRGLPLTLVVPHLWALATLRVDGNLATPIDAGSLDRYRASNPHRWRVTEDASRDGHLDLELVIAHRFVQSAWIDGAPVLTTDLRGGARLEIIHQIVVAAAIGALAAGLVVALLYGVLFVSLRDRRRAVYGWFALGAVCGMPYPAFLLGIGQPVLGVHEVPFMMAALGLGSIAAMFFARAYVGEPPPSRLWFAAFGALVVAAVVARSPFVAMLVLGPLVLLLTFANAVAQLVFLARWGREKRTQRVFVHALALAWPLTVLLGLPDLLAWLGQGELTSGVRTACLGILGISLYQATALTREHLVSLKRAGELNAELEERLALLAAKNREVELLNDELRRQIAARSRELAEKLASRGDEELGPPPELSSGDVIEDRYRVVSVLGAGGMGTVYEVERLSDQKHFALKVLAAGGGGEARARFAREAQIVANVSHPNVISIVDIDVAEEGFIFLVMELVAAGKTLHDVRRREHDVPWSLGVLAQVAAGIDAVHEAGIIHRDLKPGNILFSRGDDGRRPLVKITDFGISSLAPDGTRISAMERAAMIAQHAGDHDELDPFSVRPPPPVRVSDLERARAAPATGPRASAPPDSETGVITSVRPEALPTTHVDEDALTEVATEREHRAPPPDASSASAPAAGRPRSKRVPDTPLTEAGLIFGTPQYMAQELTTGTKNATRASDVFSLGIIAFEVLTGKRPFAEAPVTAKLNGHELPRAYPFAEACPTLPAAIGALLDRTLSHDPRDRPTAKELAIALREAAQLLAGLEA
ncbi:MAG: hypothetical protein JWP97_3233 [Labilithrix sp.]|nr:hypothetical protein [Labilithrix sp.]